MDNILNDNIMLNNNSIILDNEFFTDDISKEVNESLIHIRINQRNKKKFITTIQGDLMLDKKKILKECKKKFACNGSIVNDKEYGEVLQFQGDQRNNIYDYLVNLNTINIDNIKIH